MGVSKMICEWLAGQSQPRTMAEIRAAVFPGASAAVMHNHIGPLVRTGKLRRVEAAMGAGGRATYEATGAPDRRFAMNKPAVVLSEKARPWEDAREIGDVSADVAAFLAAGGRIERIPAGWERLAA